MHTFKKSCISNRMDETEDDVIWEDFVHSPHSTDDSDNDDEAAEDYYNATPNTLRDEEFTKLFESDECDNEFEGFDDADIKAI